jgi:hypothetical protein
MRTSPPGTLFASERLIPLLALHALAEIRCDHDLNRDLPICNCGTVNLGWWPTVQTAKEAWARHVIDAMEKAS